MDRKEIEQLYTSKGFAYRPDPQDNIESDFYDRAEDKQKIRHRLEKVIRTKAGGGKEHIIYYETLLYIDRLGNELNLAGKEMGTHKEPQFRYEYDTETRKPRAVEVIGHKTVYDIPFSKQKMQEILNIKNKDIQEAESEGKAIDDDNTDVQFILMPTVNSTTRYGGFTADEFLNRSFDELYTKATTDAYPATTTESTTREKGNKEMKEIKKGLVAEVEKGSEEEREYDKIEERLVIEPEEEPSSSSSSTTTTTESKKSSSVAAAAAGKRTRR